MNLTKKSVRFAEGDRVRINERYVGQGILRTGMTGIITGPATVKRALGDNTQGWLVRLDKKVSILSVFPNITTVLFYADELEYEDNRQGAITGDILAVRGDKVVIDGEYTTCRERSPYFIVMNNYRKGQKLNFLCPDCVDDPVAGYEESILTSPDRILYLCDYPKQANEA